MGYCCHSEMTLWLRLDGLLKALKSFQDLGKYCLQPVDLSAGNEVPTVVRVWPYYGLHGRSC